MGANFPLHPPPDAMHGVETWPRRRKEASEKRRSRAQLNLLHCRLTVSGASWHSSFSWRCTD